MESGEKGRKGEGEKGRRGEREKGRKGEGEKGRRGEREKGRKGEREKGRREAGSRPLAAVGDGSLIDAQRNTKGPHPCPSPGGRGEPTTSPPAPPKEPSPPVRFPKGMGPLRNAAGFAGERRPPRFHEKVLHFFASHWGNILPTLGYGWPPRSLPPGTLPHGIRKPLGNRRHPTATISWYFLSKLRPPLGTIGNG